MRSHAQPTNLKRARAQRVAAAVPPSKRARACPALGRLHRLSPDAVACIAGFLCRSDQIQFLFETNRQLTDAFLPSALAALGGPTIPEAVRRGSVAAVRALDAARHPVAGAVTPNTLFMAAKFGRLRIVQWLVTAGKVDVDSLDCYSSSALVIAAVHDQLDVVKWLVTHGKAKLCVPVPALGWAGPAVHSVLHVAAFVGRLRVVQWLVEHGSADPNWRDCRKQTPVFRAAAGGHAGTFNWLLARGHVPADASLRVDLNAADCTGRTVLHELASIASWSNSCSMLRRLVDPVYGVDVNRKDDTGAAAIHIAVERGMTRTLQSLVEDGGADPNTVDRQGQTALHLAAARGDLTTVEYLATSARANADVRDAQGSQAMNLAAGNGHLTTFQWLVAFATRG